MSLFGLKCFLRILNDCDLLVSYISKYLLQTKYNKEKEKSPLTNVRNWFHAGEGYQIAKRKFTAFVLYFAYFSFFKHNENRP